MEQSYNIPVVWQDLPPKEALHKVVDNLQYLDNVMDDVFAKITNRVSEERTKIQSIVKRVDKCSRRVQMIGDNTNRVTTIFSPAKYPAPIEREDYTRLHSTAPRQNNNNDDGNGNNNDNNNDNNNNNNDTNDRNDRVDLKAPKKGKYKIRAEDRSQLSAVVDTSKLLMSLIETRAHRSEKGNPYDAMDVGKEEKQEGLGRLPPRLTSVSSVLLFNSEENPYKQYVSVNNMEGVGGIDREKEVSELAQAPQTLLDGSYLPTFEIDQMAYKPDLGQVPAFDLPQNLPLGRLADINFGSQGEVASIAPSVAALPLPSFPTFDTNGSQVLALPAPPVSKTSKSWTSSSAKKKKKDKKKKDKKKKKHTKHKSSSNNQNNNSSSSSNTTTNNNHRQQQQQSHNTTRDAPAVVLGHPSSSHTQASKQGSVPSAPPPPPPPSAIPAAPSVPPIAPSVPTNAKTNQHSASKVAGQPLPAPQSGREGLLAAIRAAGVKSLKSSKRPRKQRSLEGEGEGEGQGAGGGSRGGSGGGMDLMSALKNRLKGIRNNTSGKTDRVKPKATGASATPSSSSVPGLPGSSTDPPADHQRRLSTRMASAFNRRRDDDSDDEGDVSWDDM